MKRKVMMMKIGKHSSFFARRKLNYLYPIKITVCFILTLTFLLRVPVFVNSVFIDTKHTLRYDGEVNIGKYSMENYCTILNLFDYISIMFKRHLRVSLINTTSPLNEWMHKKVNRPFGVCKRWINHLCVLLSILGGKMMM